MNTIIKKTTSELNKLLVEKREALRAFRFGGSGAKQKNVKAGVMVRRDIARILTELRARLTSAR